MKRKFFLLSCLANRSLTGQHPGRSRLPGTLVETRRSVCLWLVLDSDAGRLAGGAVQRHVDDVAVVGALLRRADDVRQLRAVQPARRHPRRRILDGRRCEYTALGHQLASRTRLS